ncbi:spore protein P [Desulforamulus ferrireducens]|uniref:Spore protein P n=1 Tax=Desulforamulus ferrireducens TaxID=1833852 RepID=A0A1S6IUX4_9FIRM|nr:spore protein P [Desulforamulus ferrireducens]AQS58569.1 spore protein P [Desulforamulus ferrireducens]
MSEVRDYVLTPEELEEVWAKYGKPGELAPGTKATKKRNSRRNQNNIQASEKSE